MRVTIETAATAQGILDDLAANAYRLAQNANDVDEPTAEQVEKAFYVLATASLEREDTAPIVARAFVYVLGQQTGDVTVG